MSEIALGLCCRDVEGMELEQQFEQAQRLGFTRVHTVSLLKPRLMCYNISGDENEEIRDNH